MFEKILKRFIYALITISLLLMAAARLISAQDSKETLPPVENGLSTYDAPLRIAHKPNPTP
mgnify:CR=1 FL=1